MKRKIVTSKLKDKCGLKKLVIPDTQNDDEIDYNMFDKDDEEVKIIDPTVKMGCTIWDLIEENNKLKEQLEILQNQLAEYESYIEKVSDIKFNNVNISNYSGNEPDIPDYGDDNIDDSNL